MKEKKNSRKEEVKTDRYDKLSESLLKKGSLVSTMLTLQPHAEEPKTERKEESKSGRIQELTKSLEEVRKVKKNYYMSEDSVILLKLMSDVEEKTHGQLIEEMILERFKKVFPTYSELDKEIFKRKYFPKLSKKAQEELKGLLDL